MSSTNDVSALRRQRGTIKAACTRINNHVNAVTEINPDIIAQIEERKIKLEEYWAQYNIVQTELEAADCDGESDDRIAFEELFYTVSARMRRITNSVIATRAPPAPSPSFSGRSETIESLSHVRLPKLDLPKFSGKYEDWFPFSDLFNSVINSNNSLTDTQRFQYLKTSLTGEAATIIQSLELTNDNYTVAWNLLKNRYDNKRIIVNAHIREIFELPKMLKENAQELRQIADGTAKHLSSLKSLKRPTDTWDDILIHILVSKLDPVTSREWYSSLTGSELPTLNQLLNFIVRQCQILETGIKSTSFSVSQTSTRAGVNRRVTGSHAATVRIKCAFCNDEHQIYYCSEFSKLSPERRLSEIKQRKLCTNCLRSTNHTSSKCNSGTCKICNAKHNTLLHITNARDSSTNKSSPSQAETSSPDSAQSLVAAHASMPIESDHVMLSTAVVNVFDKFNSPRQCRALLDCGSQANFITRAFLETLQIKTEPVNILVYGISQATTASNQIARIKLKSRVSSFTTTIDCIVTDQITQNLPNTLIKRRHIEIPRNIRLADPQFHASSSIDLLIGADLFWLLLCVGQIKRSDKHPLLHKTQLGWILAGRLGVPPERLRPKNIQGLHATITNHDLQRELQRFWDVENVQPRLCPQSLQEQSCEKHFIQNVTRDDDGRFIVRLPCKEDVLNAIGDSRSIAIRRFNNLEKRLIRNPELRAQYSNFIHEYRSLGHMKLIHEANDTTEQPTFYLPHHCVFKPSSETTKLRVVFDGSCKSTTGVSLNDALLVGPVVQQDLVSIVLRFRTFAFVFTADIVKMYRQVRVHGDQTRLQRIVWRDDVTQDIDTYELTTITYGTSAASFLATRCLQHLAEQESSNFPIGAAHVLRDFYVDDILTGADSLVEAKIIRDEVIALLRSGSFTLSKWSSNSPQLLEPSFHSTEHTVDFNKGCESRTLGIRWDPTKDCFYFTVTNDRSATCITKRSIVSEIAKLFDPLGFIGPSIIISKLIIQELWQLNLQWDESVPTHIHTRWFRFKEQLASLNQLSISRCVKFNRNNKDIQIHGFCDASQNAYGACIYLRSEVSSNNFRIELLCSKSRVAPLKAVSLPRLELCAALLLAQLYEKVRLALNITGMRKFFWSDSTITLNWISSPSRKWVVFVANRVGEIQRLTSITDWHHVSSKNNPADLLSRGVEPVDLPSCQIWWNGPSYLANNEAHWPNFDQNTQLNEMPEMRKTVIAAATIDSSAINNLINRFSSIDKICRIISYCFRFSKKHRDEPSARGVISPTEISIALKSLSKFVQSLAFNREIKQLTNEKTLDSSNNLLTLSPFIDSEGLLRVGGRLKNAELSYDAKHPILLPKGHRFTRLIIDHEHVRNMHAGVQATIAAVRQRFWPIAIRSTARSVIRSCVICFKAKPVISEAIMGALPSTRVVPSRPFSQCGVDYAGPLLIRDGKRRNSRTVKVYIAIFVCFAVKAVHIEVVSDLTTDAFLAALKRFIARRGQPVSIHSDNGTTFVGASRELKEFFEFFSKEEVQCQIHNFLRNTAIKWHFIPPNAPHFGGLWEAAVKSAKAHLYRIVRHAHLTFEEMQTVLCEIEAILNSRPITPLTEDPNDLTFLTPGHFLVGEPLNSFPYPSLTDINENRLVRWQRVEQMRQHFWRRWSVEYLNQLQERHKWKINKGEPIRTGHLVLIRQQGLSPLQWIMGRVEEVYPGADGIARSAKVKTAKGFLTRPLSRLAVLPVET